MEKGRIESTNHFWNRGKILYKMAMFNYFATKTQIAYFLRPFEEKKLCSPVEKGRIEFSITSLELRGNPEQIAYFPRQFHCGAKSISKPVSQHIAWLFRLISQPKNNKII